MKKTELIKLRDKINAITKGIFIDHDWSSVYNIFNMFDHYDSLTVKVKECHYIDFFGEAPKKYWQIILDDNKDKKRHYMTIMACALKKDFTKYDIICCIE